MNQDDIPQLGLEARRLGELLVTNCPCPHTDRWLKAHTLGEHLWHATRNMAPGVRAQAFEPRMNTPTPTTHDTDPPPDPDLAGRYQSLTRKASYAIRDLTRFIETYRPDRHMPTGPAFTDTDWCRNHLNVLGTCEPRYRGDTCRRCYGVKLTTGHLPPLAILQAWNDGIRVTDQTLAAAIAAHIADLKATGKKRKRRKTA